MGDNYIVAQTSPYGRVTYGGKRGPSSAAKAVKVTLVGFAVLAGLVLLPGILRGFPGSKRALRARASVFLEILQYKDYKTLYNFLSTRNRESLTQEQFEKVMTKTGIPGLRITPSSDIDIEDVRKNGYGGVVKVKFTDVQHSRIRVQNRTFYFVLENDNIWYYDDISE